MHKMRCLVIVIAAFILAACKAAPAEPVPTVNVQPTRPATAEATTSVTQQVEETATEEVSTEVPTQVVETIPTSVAANPPIIPGYILVSGSAEGASDVEVEYHSPQSSGGEIDTNKLQEMGLVPLVFDGSERQSVCVEYPSGVYGLPYPEKILSSETGETLDYDESKSGEGYVAYSNGTETLYMLVLVPKVGDEAAVVNVVQFGDVNPGMTYAAYLDKDGKPLALMPNVLATEPDISYGPNGNMIVRIEGKVMEFTFAGGWEEAQEYVYHDPAEYVSEGGVFDLERALGENELPMITETNAEGQEVRRLNMEAYKAWMAEILAYYEANKAGMGVAKMQLHITTGGDYVYTYDGWHIELTCVLGAESANVIGAARLADGSYVVVIADAEHVLPIHIVPGVNHKTSNKDVVSPEDVVAAIAGKIPMAYFDFFFADSDQINLAFERRDEMDPEATAILEAWLRGETIKIEELLELAKQPGGIAKVWASLKNGGLLLECVDGYRE